MSILVNPSIITDGLVGNFDIANAKINSSNKITWNNSVKNYNTSIVSTNLIEAQTPYANSYDFIDNVRCASYRQTIANNGYFYMYASSLPVRTYSFWIRKLPNYSGMLVPYFLDFINTLSNAFITSNGFGSYFTGSLCYYNGIYVGNNNFIITDILYGSLSEQWKNLVIVAPSTQTLDGELFFFTDFNQTAGNQTPYAISQMQFYNRVLSINEITANYLTFKGRYGL